MMQPRLEEITGVILLLKNKEENWINCIKKESKIFSQMYLVLTKLTYGFDCTDCLFNYNLCTCISTLSTGCHLRYNHGHRSTSHDKKRNSRTQDNGKKPPLDKCYCKAPDEG